jgi:tetratricopeptide (TPR) repeat protein
LSNLALGTTPIQQVVESARGLAHSKTLRDFRRLFSHASGRESFCVGGWSEVISWPVVSNSAREWRRFQIIKVGIALLFVVALTYVGFQGRQHARLQAKLSDLSVVCDRLQQELDEESNNQIGQLLNILKARFDEFEADYTARKLSPIENLELRIAQATVANAERRFGDALATLTSEDEKGLNSSLLPRVLRVRGDAFYGRQEWKEAFERYQRLLALQPNHLLGLARVAGCQSALGKTNEALASYRDLVAKYKKRADTLQVQGKQDAASRYLAKAAEIQRRLNEQ